MNWIRLTTTFAQLNELGTIYLSNLPLRSVAYGGRGNRTPGRKFALPRPDFKSGVLARERAAPYATTILN